MEQSGARARDRAQREEQLEEDLARARMFIVGQRSLFAGVGVTVQAMGDWGVKYQVGDNMVIDRGDVRFARMVNRLIVRGCDVNARLLELVQDQYNIGAELQVATEVPAAEAAQSGYALATALAAQVTANLRNLRRRGVNLRLQRRNRWRRRQRRRKMRLQQQPRGRRSATRRRAGGLRREHWQRRRYM